MDSLFINHNEKKSLRIGIDIDGVINNLEGFYLDYGTRYCFENNLPVTPNPFAYKIRHMYNWDKEEELKFFRTYAHIFFLTNQYLRGMASSVISYLLKKHKIYLLTARPSSLINELAIQKKYTTELFTQEWLKQQNISYNQLIFTSADKRETIKEHAIDIIIEDNPDFLKLVANQQPLIAFCYHASYNMHISGENIVRVYSWYNILDHIREIEKFL